MGFVVFVWACCVNHYNIFNGCKVMLIMDKWLRSIASAGDVDISADIDPCPDEFAHESAPLPERVGCALGSRIEDDAIPLCDCVKECQKVSAEWREHMRRLGIEV